MKKIILTILISTIIFAIPISVSAKTSDLVNDLNNCIETHDADFTKASVKDKTIIVTVDDSFVEPPVVDAGKDAFLSDLFGQIKTIQKCDGTKYSLIIKDKASGKLAKVNYKGIGWVKDSYGKTETDFNN